MNIWSYFTGLRQFWTMIESESNIKKWKFETLAIIKKIAECQT